MIVKHKKSIPDSLIAFGFVLREGSCVFERNIMDGEFRLEVCVNGSDISYSVFDNETGDEYTLVHNESAVGAFVGRVRAECESVIADVIGECFVYDIFRNRQTKAVIAHVSEKYGISLDHPFADSPENAVFRDPKSKKWFAAILTVGSRKLGIDSDCESEIINLKASPDRVAELLSLGKCMPAYHMNKKHWYTVVLDENLPDPELFYMIDESYDAVARKK